MVSQSLCLLVCLYWLWTPYFTSVESVIHQSSHCQLSLHNTYTYYFSNIYNLGIVFHNIYVVYKAPCQSGLWKAEHP